MLTFEMSSNNVQCEMCCKEQAVGCCNICGNICESCCVIHKKGRAFQTHILKMYGKDGYNSRSIVYDITEEICKHHLTEKASLFCKIHNLMICGRCFRSDHISCAQEVVDLCNEAGHFNNDQCKAMSAALNDIQDAIKRTKEELDRKTETCKNHAVKCNKELDDFENKLKRKLEYSINSLRQEARKFQDENMHAFSFISAICEKKKSWAIQQESQLKEFVQNSFTGRLYLMNQKFEQEISEVKKEIREAKCKHNVKLFCLKDSKVALKCLIEDLRDVCELQEEVDGSDEGTTYAIGDASTDQQKAKDELCDELEQMKQKLITSEKMRMELHDDLERVKQDLDHSKKECALLQAKGLPIKQCIEWKQPTGSVEVTVSQYQRFSIGLLFTFQDGIQTRYHPFPGQPYKGSTIAGRLKNDSEGQTVCRLLKTAFRRGRMFTVGHDGNVWLSGISMFDSDFLAIVPISHYAEYIQGVKAELKAKGITEDTIDQTETVEGIFIVDGP